MNEIVDRDTFLYYLDNADVNWEATARECIAKGFELAEENKKLKEQLEKVKKICKKYEETNTYFDLTFDVINDILKILEGAEE